MSNASPGWLHDYRINQAIKAGINQVITKPVQLSILGEALEQWLEKNTRLEPITLKINETTMKNNLPVINYGTLHTLQLDMEEVFEEVYQSVFSSIQSSIEKLHFKQQSPEDVARLLHSIRSPAASVGAEQLAALARQYEVKANRGEIDNLSSQVAHLKEYFSAVREELQDFKLNPE